MDKPCIIQADFSTFRPVSGRKVLQLTFEVPIEQTRDVLEKLGIPTPGENRWCAIALLDLSKLSAAPQAQAAPTKDRRPFSSLPLSQQAGIRSTEPEFLRFLWAIPKGSMCINVEKDEDICPEWIRKLCGVESRGQLIAGTKAGDAWLDLEAQYQTWLTDQKYAGSRR